tara:strand:- start:11686 stop:12546 length:861 start_codon:yes stop_codon:yes gene_type:complete
MNYQKIYNDFITDRRSKEYTLTKGSIYSERHHILPKCKGGGDDKENIIRLTYRDHIFAHALLLKGAKGFQDKWHMAASMAAILNFDSRGRRCGKIKEWMEVKYKWARVMHSKCITGKGHPGYNHDEISLYHIDGTIVTGTRQELIKKTGLNFKRIYDFFNSKRTYQDGWCVSEHELICRVESEAVRNSRKQRAGIGFYHEDGRSVLETNKTQVRQYGLNGRIRDIIRRNGYSAGWSNDHIEAKMRSKGEWRGKEREKKNDQSQLFRNKKNYKELCNMFDNLEFNDV